MRRRQLVGAAGILAFSGLFALITANPSLRAEQSEKRTWRLTVEGSEHRLGYGTDNAEDIAIAFSCTPGRGRIEVFMAETSTGVKPRRAMTASLTAGSTTSNVRGKTLPNEEAGTPSFQGAMPVHDPLFTALSKERSLAIVVGPARNQIPLREIGDKADRFSGLCQKK